VTAGPFVSAPLPGTLPMNKKMLLLLATCVDLPRCLHGQRFGHHRGRCPDAETREGQVDKAVAYVLTHYHYSREPLDRRWREDLRRNT